MKTDARASRRIDARSEASSDRLLEAAEELFGRYGLDGVSLRQIGQAAGSGNNYAVQYHFGDVEGLARAILAKRIPEVGTRQIALLAQADSADGGASVRLLVAAFLLPLIEQRNSRDERAYARFIAALLMSPKGVDHCKALFELTSATAQILGRLHKALAHLPWPVLEERLRWMTILVCTSVSNRVAPEWRGNQDAAFVEDALDVAATGLAAAVRAPLALSKDTA